MVDRFGIINENDVLENPAHREIAALTNKRHLSGVLADAMKGADVFIGVSAPGVVNGDMIRSMANDPIVFPMANPVPEIQPGEAEQAGAAIVGTGRSD